LFSNFPFILIEGLLNKSIIFELVRDALPLLAHPNLWINNGLIALILTLASRLSLADINCKIKPLVEPHLARTIHSLKNGALIIDSIYPPIPRPIYELILASKLNIEQLFECLTQKKILRAIPRHHQSSTVVEDALYTRLTHEGMNDQIEDQLLRLSELIRKINRNKKNLQIKKLSGTIVITKRAANRRCFSVILRDPNQEKSTIKRQTSTMNEEWLHMFGSNAKLISSNDEDVESVIPVAHEAREYEQSHIQCPPCHKEINKLIQHKKNEYTPIVVIRVPHSSSFKPKGVLVAHLHEHESAVRRILRVGETSLFATCSSDGTVKIWDSSRMEGKSVANRSRLNYLAQSTLNQQSVGGMTYCKDCIIAFTSNNFVHILEISSSSLRMKLINTFLITPDIPGSTITDITTINSNVFAISLSDSSILGYDLRIIQSDINAEVKPIWKLNIAAHERLITSIDGNEIVLFAGTSRGLLITFDLRFLLRSNTSSYPTQNRIRRIKYTEEGLYSAGKGFILLIIKIILSN
jgi:phosphoinositide-3-kinase regulatory subunit 4